MAKTVLKAPVVTEKAMAQASLGCYAFEVEKNATKTQIKKAVQQAFGVDVLRVRTISLPGKRRKMGRHFFQVSGKKKAIIQVGAGQKIDVFGEGPAQTAPPAKPGKEKKEEKA